MAVVESGYPHLSRVVDVIAATSVFQKKAVGKLLAGATPEFVAFADDLVRRLNEALGGGDNYEFLAVSYLDYTKSIRLEEMRFNKEGRYRRTSFDEAYRDVYGRDDYMRFYVAGLGMTQIFWPNHHAIVRFFLDDFLPRVRGFERGAEVGLGHGFFHSELLRAAPAMRTTMMDVSPVALAMAHAMIRAIGLDAGRAEAVLVDVQKEIPVPDGSLDALLMGELIEHLEQPDAVMSAFAKKMSPRGLCFFTTAANAPAEDHILLFKTAVEIRAFLARHGWRVVREQTGTLNGMSLEDAERGGHNINYAAVLAAASTGP